jgi:6-pyruvoyltetrahydropterin/6-carboxytetrahydropterin synthase
MPGDGQPVFKVGVSGVQFVAGHMATFGGTAEPLHGHNYEVACEAEGTLTEDAWVVDFIALKDVLNELAGRLDHRFMLQLQSRVIHIDDSDARAWKLETPSGASYVFPRSDVVALPVDNSTAERLSQWFCEGVWQSLAERGASNLQSLKVTVNEGPVQTASYTKTK